MFNIFGKGKKELTTDDRKPAFPILEKLEALKIKSADGLGKITRNWSKKKWKIALILFCLITGGASSYIIVSSVIGKQSQNQIPVTKISVPENVTNQDVPSSPGFTITDQEYSKIQEFRQYFDSLNNSFSGKKLRDSILRARHGLLDSVRLIEELYLLQKNKSHRP